MNRICFIEEKRYTFRDIEIKLDNDPKVTKTFISELINRKIIKKEDNTYKFKYVGLILVYRRFVFIQPKYIKEQLEIENQNKLIKLLKQYSLNELLTVEEAQYLGYNNGENSNFFGIINFLLDDYINNGLYLKERRISQINGFGQINWNRTLENNKVMFIDSANPLYYELITNGTDINYNFIITHIHKLILNRCIDFLEENGLCEVFGYEDLSINFDVIDIDNEYIISFLEKELNVEFSDRRTMLLKAMIKFIEMSSTDKDGTSLNLYGTPYFNIVWEKVAAYVFSNDYDSFKDKIPKPSWIKYGEDKGVEKDTLIPDIIFYKEIYKTLFILDAKYYNCWFGTDGKIKGNVPGINDIIKQIAYESVFSEIYSNIVNVFIMPTCMDTEVTGSVQMNVFGGDNTIKIIHVNAEKLYDYYLKRSVVDETFWSEIGLIETLNYKGADELINYSSNKS